MTCRCPMHPTKSLCMVSIHLLPRPCPDKCSYKSPVTYSDNDRLTWVAHANTTQSSRLAFKATGTTSTTNLLCLKQGNSMTNPVIFTGINTDTNTTAEGGTITDTWSLYGSNVLLTQPNGNFYAKSTGKNGCWQLLWSTSQSAGLEAIPLALRTNPPVLT